MKSYIIISGTIFGLVTMAHIWRIAVEGSKLARDPFFLLLTILAAGLCVWACQLVRVSKRP